MNTSKSYLRLILNFLKSQNDLAKLAYYSVTWFLSTVTKSYCLQACLIVESHESIIPLEIFSKVLQFELKDSVFLAKKSSEVRNILCCIFHTCVFSSAIVFVKSSVESGWLSSGDFGIRSAWVWERVFLLILNTFVFK